MPVSTELNRNGQALLFKDIKGGKAPWAWWHVEQLAQWMREETPDVELYMGFPNGGSYIFKQAHTATVHESEVWQRGYEDQMYTFSVEVGDEYRAWR